MKQKILLSLSMLILGGAFMSFRATPQTESIQWLTWEQAVQLNKTQPKKFLIDIYTDWCGWCKVMDKNTFPDVHVAQYLNKYFHCVKLNAEQRDSIRFNNYTFKYLQEGRNGVHELAYSLVDGQMSYPTIVYLTERFERVVISPGYKKPEQILPELKFVGEELYKTKTWEAYVKSLPK